MAEGIVYLDVDDEITSAASRIRSAPGTKVALVVPYGSRIATSRINFRLLSREALVSNRRLSVVAGDPASRALAASAGLPVFATVAEYEAALAGPKPSVEEDFVAGPPVAEPVATPPRPAPPARRPKRSKAGALGAEAVAAGPSEIPPITAPDRGSRPAQDQRAFDPPTERTSVDSTARSRVRTPVAATVAAVALAAVVVAVLGFLLLPSASIALTPRQEPIGPITLTIAADPTATAVDPANSVVPAIRLDVPAEASKTFTTTGRKVDEAPAAGSVTFENYNTGGSNTVRAGSVVSTEGGIRFKTQAAITLPPAALVPTTPVTVQPSRRSVAVTAVKPGTEGNVPANAIRAVPQGENPQLLKVNNPNPTSGGVHTETPQITKAEVDKAVAELQKALQASFDAAIAAGALAPAGTELFPATAAPGTPTFSVDPTSLVGQAVETFDLGVTAKGTIIAVDPSPIRSIAEARLTDAVGADHHLVDGSVQIDVGSGSVGEDGQVTFEATARATRVKVVDPNQLRAVVKGRTAADAEAALAPYGVARVSLWPAWVTTVTGIDARLSVSVAGTAGASGSGPNPSPAASRGSAAP
jgi:hypothetical protein